ncbi:MAG: hypothetical protein ACQEQV_09220 [Fibrobacterota bacterium]
MKTYGSILVLAGLICTLSAFSVDTSQNAGKESRPDRAGFSVERRGSLMQILKDPADTFSFVYKNIDAGEYVFDVRVSIAAANRTLGERLREEKEMMGVLLREMLRRGSYNTADFNMLRFSTRFQKELRTLSPGFVGPYRVRCAIVNIY